MSKLTDDQLLAAANALDLAYAEADAFDAVRAQELLDCDCDEMGELRKAALNCGRP